ncbi:hypothetical protein E3J95_04995, partial [Candidatus Aerophobetes bacterium]
MLLASLTVASAQSLDLRELVQEFTLDNGLKILMVNRERYWGIFAAYSITRADATEKTIQLVLKELQRIRTERVSQQE